MRPSVWYGDSARWGLVGRLCSKVAAIPILFQLKSSLFARLLLASTSTSII